ncbi:MAG TPA: PilZ domain-containing protein [Phycisphaerae bacterium]|nr:PilZ domain-containing protein [Phycisphaerales bacterium]HRX84980.1 PilZ domain-containing protein [Phycisphaerae bacterium]
MIDDCADMRFTVDGWLAEARSFPRAEPEPTKRAEMRYPWNVPMELMDGQHVHYVHCRDISAQGAGVLCRMLLPDNARVYLRRDERDPWVRCRVAHCTPTVGSYRVGIELLFD